MSDINKIMEEALQGLKYPLEREVRDAFYRLMLKKPELMESLVETEIVMDGVVKDTLLRSLGLKSQPAPAAKEGFDTLEKLRHLMGYIENGTSGSVSICQDEATKSYVVNGGFGKIMIGDTLEAAIDAAYERMPKDEGGYPT